MADYLVTDNELASVADAIRMKGGTSEPMVWPNGYKEAIEAINAKSTLRVDTGTFTLAEDTQAPAITHNLGVIPDLVIVEAVDHDNTTYSILGFAALNPALLRTTAFGGVTFIIHSSGSETCATANKNGESAFINGLSDTRFVCAYNSGNYKYRAGWTYEWKVFAGLTQEDNAWASAKNVEEVAF